MQRPWRVLLTGLFLMTCVQPNLLEVFSQCLFSAISQFSPLCRLCLVSSCQKISLHCLLYTLRPFSVAEMSTSRKIAAKGAEMPSWAPSPGNLCRRWQRTLAKGWGNGSAGEELALQA